MCCPPPPPVIPFLLAAKFVVNGLAKMAQPNQRTLKEIRKKKSASRGIQTLDLPSLGLYLPRNDLHLSALSLCPYERPTSGGPSRGH